MQSIRSRIRPDICENQGDNGNHQHGGACFSNEMHRQRTVITLRQNQYKNRHDQISQSDDDQHPPWNDVSDSKRENTAENQ